jgi:hypothetical protein
MGSKRETVTQRSSEAVNNPSKYLVTARVGHASQGMPSSSGPVALIQAETTGPSQEQEEGHECLKIMAMGLPRSRPEAQQSSHTGELQTIPSVQVGDLVGIHRGLTWEVELHEFQALSASQGISLESNNPSDVIQRWLVAMEWDIIPDS